MFDVIAGLPVHPLVLHAFVILGPLAALSTLAFVARPAWWRVLAWPTVVLAVIAGGSAFMTKESGEALEKRLTRGISPADKALPAVKEQLDQIHEHAEAGDTAFLVAGLFMVFTLATVWLLARRHLMRTRAIASGAEPAAGDAAADARARGPLGLAVRVLTGLAALALLATVFLAGHSGATSVWKDQIANTQSTK